MTVERMEEDKTEMEEKKMDKLDRIIIKFVGRSHGEAVRSRVAWR